MVSFDPEQDYAYALMGRFMAEYARTEAYVHYLTRCRSGLNDETGRIAFAGMRLGDLTERLRGFIRLAEKEPGEYQDIDACLVQLKLVGKARHSLAHRYVTVWKELLSASTVYTSKGKHEEETYSLIQLEEMIDDCQRIRERILRHTDGEARRKERHDPTWLPTLFAPWRYKPLEPNIPRPLRRDIP